MNMISTGAFLNEMDASNKQPTVAEKFAAVWEKKNAKAARAGGVSLMALSLAACGSSSTTTTTTTTDTTTTTTTPTVTAKTMTLTLNEDTGAAFVGTSAGDTYNAGALQAANATTGYPLSSLDSLDGAGGADVLNATVSASISPVLANIETLNVKAAAGTANLSLSNATGVTSVANNASAFNLAISDSSAIVALDISGVNSGGTTTLDYTAKAVQGSADAQTVTLGANASMGTVSVGDSGAGFETVNIEVNGTTVGGTFTSAAKTMNISGAGDLTLTGGLTATTLDAGSATGKMTLTMDADGDTVTMGSGADSLTIGDADATAFNATIAMGAGNDTLTLSTLGITAISDLTDNKVTLDGGAGEDTLVLTDNAANNLTALSAANYAKKGITGFEKLQISTAMDLDVVATRMGINDINIKAGVGADKTLTVLPGAKISLGAAASDVTAGGGDTLTVTATGANAAGASSDAITLTLAGAHAAATTSVNYGEVTIANVETINIVSSDSTTAYVAYTAADHNIVDLVATSATTINVTGDLGLELNDGALENIAAVTTFNASGHTGPSLGVSFDGGAAVTFTGGSGADTVVGSANADTISTGAGNDVITGGAGADVITTGAGTDTVTVAAQSSAGIDQITDFNADSDSIITGVTEDSTAFTNVSTTDLSSSATLQAAAGAAVAAALAASGGAANWADRGAAVQFEYGGKDYLTVNVDDGGSTYSTADILVEITGYTGTLSHADILAS